MWKKGLFVRYPKSSSTAPESEDPVQGYYTELDEYYLYYTRAYLHKKRPFTFESGSGDPFYSQGLTERKEISIHAYETFFFDFYNDFRFNYARDVIGPMRKKLEIELRSVYDEEEEVWSKMKSFEEKDTIWSNRPMLVRYNYLIMARNDLKKKIESMEDDQLRFPKLFTALKYQGGEYFELSDTVSLANTMAVGTISTPPKGHPLHFSTRLDVHISRVYAELIYRYMTSIPREELELIEKSTDEDNEMGYFVLDHLKRALMTTAPEGTLETGADPEDSLIGSVYVSILYQMIDAIHEFQRILVLRVQMINVYVNALYMNDTIFKALVMEEKQIKFYKKMEELTEKKKELDAIKTEEKKGPVPPSLESLVKKQMVNMDIQRVNAELDEISYLKTMRSIGEENTHLVRMMYGEKILQQLINDVSPWRNHYENVLNEIGFPEREDADDILIRLEQMKKDYPSGTLEHLMEWDYWEAIQHQMDEGWWNEDQKAIYRKRQWNKRYDELKKEMSERRRERRTRRKQSTKRPRINEANRIAKLVESMKGIKIEDELIF